MVAHVVRWPVALVFSLVLAALSAHEALAQHDIVSDNDWVVLNEEDLIEGLSEPQWTHLIVRVDIVIESDKWDSITVDRDVTLQGSNQSSRLDGPGTARPTLLDFNHLMGKLSIAAGVTLTLSDLELKHYSAGMGQSFLDPNSRGTIVFNRTWLHWNFFTDIKAFAAKESKVPRPAAHPGEQLVYVVDPSRCKDLMPFWPGVCTAGTGILYEDFVSMFGLPPSGGEVGYTLILDSTFLSTDAVLSPACLSTEGFDKCYRDAGSALLQPQAHQRHGGLNMPAIVGGTVAGGVALAAVVAAFLILRRRRKAKSELGDTGSKSVRDPTEFWPIVVVEGSQYPSGAIQVLPDAPAPADLSLELQAGIAIGCLVGMGSFGMVHKGLFNGRRVALKLLVHTQADTMEKVMQEVQITAAVHHDNVAATYCCLQLDRESLAASGKASFAHIARHRLHTAPSTRNMSAREATMTSICTSDLSAESTGGSSMPCYLNVAGSSLTGGGAAAASSDVEEGLSSRLPGSNQSLLPPYNSSRSGGSRSGGSVLRATPTTFREQASPSAGPNRVPGIVCLVMEYLDGGSLLSAQEEGHFSDRDGNVDLVLLWPLLMDVARGMDALHAMDVCHGDLKSDNCVLSKPLEGPCECACHSSSPPATAHKLTGTTCSKLEQVFHSSRQQHALRGLEPIREGSGSSNVPPLLSTEANQVSGSLGSGALAGAEAHAAIQEVATEAQISESLLVMPKPEPDNKASHRCCEQCRPVVKITDFGLVRALLPTVTHVSTASHGAVTHMPPEVLMDGHMRPASDVYSFGIMVFELVTGKRAWQGYTYPQVVRMVGMEGCRPPLPASMPPLLQQMLHECWAADPAERPTFKRLLECMAAAAKAGSVERMALEMRSEVAGVMGFL